MKGVDVVVLMSGLEVEAAVDVMVVDGVVVEVPCVVVVMVVDGVEVLDEPGVVVAVQEALSGVTHLSVTGSKMLLFGQFAT